MSDRLHPISSGLLGILRRELSPAPGRLGNTLRLVVLVMVSVTISEVFRMPEAALSAYVVLFVSRGEATSTVITAAIAGLAVLLALLATIVVFMASLSEPALRLPLVALATFTAMFLSRTSRLGPAFFAGGFIVAYGLTLGDEVLQLSLMPGSAANTPEFALPERAFFPPEEALLHFLLWLSLVVGMPVGLVIAANLLTGRDPAVILRAALAERLAAAARFCAGEPGAEQALARLAREGTAELSRLNHLSGLRRGTAHREVSGASLVHEVSRLCLVLLAWARLPATGPTRALLLQARQACEDAERAVHGCSPTPAREVSGREPPATGPASAVVRPLALETSRALQAIRNALSDPLRPAVTHAPGSVASPRRLLAADAFSNPAYARFAFKVTLAVMLCYLGETLADWPGIHTCFITCFFVSLDTIGETAHKAALRIVGCLIGGALGIVTILVLMPWMTDLGDLLLAVAAVTLLAGWIAGGSERISYAGWQIALAFYLGVLQGYGPTLDMQTARDRIAGILIGNLVVFAIFTTIWPVSLHDLVRANLAKAMQQLGRLMEIDGPQPRDGDPRRAFSQAIVQAHGLMIDDPYETGLRHPANTPPPIDAALLTRVQALIVPVSVISDLAADAAWQEVPETIRDAVHAYHRAMADWFQACVPWMRSGAGAFEIRLTLPELPAEFRLPDDVPIPSEPVVEHLQARMAWYRLLHQDIRAILPDAAHPANAAPRHRYGLLALS